MAKIVYRPKKDFKNGEPKVKVSKANHQVLLFLYGVRFCEL